MVFRDTSTAGMKIFRHLLQLPLLFKDLLVATFTKQLMRQEEEESKKSYRLCCVSHLKTDTVNVGMQELS